MSQLKCDYCASTFSNKYILDKHQKTAKFCLKLQNNSESNFISECTYCDKKFFRKDRFLEHLDSCKIKKNNEYKNQEDQILMLKHENLFLNQNIKNLENINKEQLQRIKYLEIQLKDYLEMNTKTISDLASKAIENAGNKTFNTTTTKNKIVNSLIPLTDEYMREQTKFFTIDHVKHGTQSLALFAKDYTFKDRIAITDASRNKFVFKDENGNLINDPNGVKITDKFIEINKEVLIEVLTQYMGILKIKISKAYDEFDTVLINKYEGELIEANSILQTIKNQNEPQNIKSFDKLKGDFIKNLCSMLETV